MSYIRYYAGHTHNYGHEFIEYELHPDGRLRYANSSKYKREETIRKQLKLTPIVVKEIMRIVDESGIANLDTSKWPPADSGKQELEINDKLISTAKIGSLQDIIESNDPEGLKALYYLSQDLKGIFQSLMKAHFKASPL